MKKISKFKCVIIILAVAVVILMVVVLFDFFKFYKLETFSENEIENVCLTMSQISDAEVKRCDFPNDNKYVLCFVNGEDEQALFIIEKVYYHNLKSTERFKVKYENVDSENEVSSISFDIDEAKQAVIYFWNDDMLIESADYTLKENKTNNISTNSISDIQDNYVCIEYLFDDFSLEQIDFYDSNNSVVYSEKRAEGRQGGLIED
ncbi:MAG: hypothetical protein ACI4IE_06555 [Eubacterium sp.]